MALLRVATFNLLHGIGLSHGQVRPDELRAAAKELDADVVGLQEVDHGQERSGRVDQTGLVAEALGAAHHRFVPAVHGTPGEDWQPSHAHDGREVDGPTYGIGLVSRLPVRQWDVQRYRAAPFGLPLMIPAQPRPRFIRVSDEPRAAVAAVVDGPDGPLTVITTHLSFVPGFNVVQLRRLVQWAGTLPGPRLLLGDFNLPGPLPGLLSGWTPLVRTPTYPSPAPRVQLDHVLAQGLDAAAVTRAEAVRLPVSDHCALVVELEL